MVLKWIIFTFHIFVFFFLSFSIIIHSHVGKPSKDKGRIQRCFISLFYFFIIIKDQFHIFSQIFLLALHSTTEFFVFQQSFSCSIDMLLFSFMFVNLLICTMAHSGRIQKTQNPKVVGQKKMSFQKESVLLRERKLWKRKIAVHEDFRNNKSAWANTVKHKWSFLLKAPCSLYILSKFPFHQTCI